MGVGAEKQDSGRLLFKRFRYFGSRRILLEVLKVAVISKTETTAAFGKQYNINYSK